MSINTGRYALMSFEDRQRIWEGEPREFRQHHGRAERPTVWQINVTGDRVFTQHGLLEGAMQQTNYVGKAKNVGRANSIDSAQDALAEARRDVRKKWDFEGYDEYVGGVNIDRRHEDINIQALLTNLPSSFCLYKPENNLMDQKKLFEKAKKGEVLYTIKRDGVAKWIVVDYYGNIQIYSRRSRAWQDTEGPKELPDGTLDYSTVVPWTARFPHLVEAVKKLQLHPGSMMAVELVAPESMGDNFPYISGLTKGYTKRALEDMAHYGMPIVYWWDVPFYDGQDWVSTKPVIDRYKFIQEMCKVKVSYPYIFPIQFITVSTPEEAITIAKANNHEGYVVVDPNAVYGNKGWNLKGKPDRPSSCAKLKPSFEDDFVAIWAPDGGQGEWGTGKHEVGKQVKLPDGRMVVHGGVGAVALYQYNSDDLLVYIGKVASGMDYAFQAQLRVTDFPAVWMVEYTERTYVSDGEKTNALRFPRFLRVRDDKRQEECINPHL